MHADIARYRSQIAALCNRYGVLRLEVFGSALREDFDSARSDIDLVVEFDPHSAGSALRRYFDFKADLEGLLGRDVDLVELGAMENSRLKRLIENSKVPLYAASA